MKVLLRHRVTGMYFCDVGKWTSDPGQAVAFPRSTTALQFVAEEQLRGVEVVFHFKDKRFNIHLPTLDKSAASP